MFWNEFILVFVALFAISNPITCTAMFLSMTPDDSEAERRRIAIKTSIAVFVIMLASVWLGRYILDLFGISEDAFRTAGGLIVVMIGMTMLMPKDEGGGAHKLTDDEHAEAIEKKDISVVPMAMPMIAGPGLIVTLISFAHLSKSTLDLGILSVVCVVYTLSIAVCLYYSGIITKFLSDSAMTITSRVMGLLLMAIGVQMLQMGLMGLFPVLSSNLAL